MSKTTLHLTLKKKWFDMILSDEKKEEYREVKEFSVPRCMQLNKPLQLDQFSINYKRLIDAFWFCVGYKGSGINAVNYLVNELAIASFRKYDVVVFKNGYSKNAPEMKVEFKGIELGEPKPEWSDNFKGNVFIIKLGEILETKNIKS